MKKVSILAVLIMVCATIVTLSASTSVHAGNADKDGCEKGGMDGLMNVSSKILNNQFKGLAGGTDYGMEWVCSSADNRNARKGTLYFAKKVKAKVKAKATKTEPAVYYYTIYPDIELSSGNETQVMMIGQVHTNKILTMENYARQIGVCRSATVGVESSCPAGSKATVTFKDGTTADVFKSLPSGNVVHRQTNKSTSIARAIQGYWARPYICENAWIPNSFNVGDEFECTTTNATINNKVLKRAIDEGGILSTTLVDVGNKKMTKVKFYLHHQWSGTSDGSAYTGTANVSTIYLLVDYEPDNGWKDTFKAKVEASVKGKTAASDGIYYTSDDSITAVFKHSIARESTNSGAAISEPYQIWYKTAASSVSSATNPTPNENTTVSINDKEWHVVKNNREQQVTLKNGKNVICDTIGWNKSVDNKGKTEWDKKDGCVTVYKYAWYDMSGQVVVDTNATLGDDGIYWSDENTATLKFTHQVSTTSSVAVKAKYKTRKNPTINNDFSIVESYTQDSTAITNDSGWRTVHTSPSEAKSVTVEAGDTGSTYTQYLDYYSKVREDSGDYSSTKTATGTATFRRYKTTFTGSTQIYVNSDNVTDDKGNKIGSTTNVDKKTIYVSGTSYPVDLPITFEHTVTRSNNDAHGSPSTRSSGIKTEVTNHTGIRDTDPYGSPITDSIGPLAAGGNGSKTDTFTAKIYPEHSITLCQQMEYDSEVQGTSPTATAKADEACVTIVMNQADCLGNKHFGIKNGKNYLRAEIYKNNSEAASVKSADLYQGTDNTITEWAKPGDQIRFNYLGCAGGEIARQYANADTYTTSYSISTDTAGYLFGREVGKDASDTYNALSTTIGSSSSTDGTGPFGSSGSFTTTVGSPSGDSEESRLYSCNYHGASNAMDNFYRIPAYIANVSESDYRSKCVSDDTGRVSDLGETITQYATWTDLQYENGSTISGHNGSSSAKVTAQVKVPYNYTTNIKVSGDGGYVFPGTKHTEKALLNVNRRTNGPVNGSTEYVTVTKPTKSRLIRIIVDSDDDTTADTFNGLVNGDTLFADDDGSKALDSELTVCKSFDCTIVSSSDNKQYDARNNNGTTGQEVGSYQLSIPYNVDPGVKYCFIAAVWPSDSHNNPDLTDIDDAANGIAMRTGSISGSKWNVSGATCYTAAKRPNIQIFGSDGYAQRYITGNTTKYPENNDGTNPRIYGSWSEYGLVAGDAINGFASGATLWGGSNIVSNKPDKNLNCVYSPLTFSNSGCSGGNLGSMAIDLAASSNPKNLADQIKTRYTRDNSDAYTITRPGEPTIPISNSGFCRYTDEGYEKVPSDGAFDCIGDTGVKYTHVVNGTSQTASIQSTFCLSKGSDDNNRISVIHVDRTLVIGANVYYGSGDECSPESYSSLTELPQYIFVAKKIVIKEDVEHIDGWLVADEIVTCDPSGDDDWSGSVTQSKINSKNCDKQLTINGPVITKNIKLFRTYGSGFDDGTLLASPAEIFKMGPDVYLWAFGQAERYGQATTTYSRELAPRY